MEPLQNLVYYAAVAKRTTVLADYEDAGSGAFAHMASKCLEHIPPLHNSFSYTTSNRMFICLMEDLFIYYAIMDEALSKAKAFMFLEHMRDAFRVLLQQKDVYPDMLTSHSLHSEMGPFFKHLVSSLVGLPQREKVRMREEQLILQAQRDADNDFEVSSPSAVAPLSDEDFDLQTEHKPMSSLSASRSPRMPLIGKGRRGKKKSREYDKGAIGSPMDSSCEALNKSKCLQIMVDDNSPRAHVRGHRACWQEAQDRWWRNVKLIIVLDVIVCILLLAIWLAVCEGVNCLKKN